MMLAQMTALQFQELLHFFHIEEEEKERMEAEAQENRLRQFMERKMAEQKREKDGA